MSQPVSDAAVELLWACRHRLRFTFGTPVGYPYAAAQLSLTDPPPALFRRVQVASPPPARDSAPWQTGLRTSSGPFDPAAPPERLREVWAQEGAVALDLPDPDSLVLDAWFRVPRAGKTLRIPGPDQDRCFLSVPYWRPDLKEPVERAVEYYTEQRLEFVKEPRGDWIAISFDAFWPPERDSADLIARLGACDDDCPPKVR